MRVVNLHSIRLMLSCKKYPADETTQTRLCGIITALALTDHPWNRTVVGNLFAATQTSVAGIARERMPSKHYHVISYENILII